MKKDLHPVVKKLLSEIYVYLALSGDNATQFGRKAMRDGSFLPRIQGGRVPTISTIERVRDYIARNSKAVRPRK
jgi:hypothetical protein